MSKYKLIIIFALISQNLWSKNICTDIGGKVTPMNIIYQTGQGKVTGFKQKFCSFAIDNGLAIIGLKSMNSKLANIAASYILTLESLDNSSPLWEGQAQNPSHNVCHNLGGTNAQAVAPGSFTSEQGENDICVFGDGSMISGWTLIYIANQREGFNLIKDNIPSKALPLFHP
ncbi:MAG: hypothetical protein QG556_943 [Pseudomonadota bacterium]|nr:hypothetical protein [Pseudomonadota bacterium]